MDSDNRSIRELIDALADTPLGAELKEPELFRQRTYRELAEHDDPVLREIGQQLRDGLIRPHQLMATPAYQEVVLRGLQQVRSLSKEDYRAALVAYLESLDEDRRGRR